MAFRFRYESLLSYRRHLEERAEVEFSTARQHWREAQDTLASLSRQFDVAGSGLQADLAGKIPSHELKNHAEYLSSLKDKITGQALEVSSWRKIVEEKRGALLRVARDVKIMERLKEKDLEKWKVDQKRLEQKRLSEIALLRHQKVSS